MLIELNLNSIIKLDVLKYNIEIVDISYNNKLISNFKFRISNLNCFKNTLLELETYMDKNISIDVLNSNYKNVVLKNINIENISGTYCEVVLSLIMEEK